MNRDDQEVALRWAFREEHVIVRFHGHLEMSYEGLDKEDLFDAGTTTEVIEDYPDRPEGHTKLLSGTTRGGDSVHIVVNVEAFEANFEDQVEVVTVYRPERPRWRDETTRGGN